MSDLPPKPLLFAQIHPQKHQNLLKNSHKKPKCYFDRTFLKCLFLKRFHARFQSQNVGFVSQKPPFVGPTHGSHRLACLLERRFMTVDSYRLRVAPPILSRQLIADRRSPCSLCQRTNIAAHSIRFQYLVNTLVYMHVFHRPPWAMSNRAAPRASVVGPDCLPRFRIGAALSPLRSACRLSQNSNLNPMFLSRCRRATLRRGHPNLEDLEVSAPPHDMRPARHGYMPG